MASLAQEKLLLEAASHYSQEINEETLSYLEGRGISEVVAARFQLGTITNPIAGHENYPNWLSIPYVTALGLVAGFKFRRLDDGKPKYGSPLGQKSHLYNVADVLLDSHRIVICEGELDTVILSGVCGIPAVGVPGVAAWKPHFSKLFGGYDVIYIIGDNDVKEDGTNPGAEFARRVASEVLNSTIISLPPTMDVNDYYLANGIDGIKKLLGVISE